MSQNIFRQVIFNSNKTTSFGFSLGKYTNTTPLTTNTVFSGCLSGSGSLMRIHKYDKKHPKSTLTNITIYNISNWNEINPTSLNLGNWLGIVCSSSGQYVYTSNTNFVNPSIWMSNNYGQSFTQSSIELHHYANLSVNSLGKFFICPAIRDRIFYSTDYGVNVEQTNDPGGFWWVSAMNYTGSISCIAKSFNNSGDTTPNPIFISNNQSLFSPILNGLYYNWSGITMNNSGNLIIACSYDGYVYYTTNTGNSWNTFSLPKYIWSSVSTSSNGNYICLSSLDGYIYVSQNGGQTWNSCSPNNTAWSSIYVAGNTNLLLACGINDYIYYSSNYGLSWKVTNPNNNSSNWSSICCSDDGKYIYACVNGGNIYTTITSTN